MSYYSTPYVFVYDVFLKDAVKHVKIAPYVKTWSQASMPGKLYQLPTGLPIVVEEDPNSKVYGEVMTFDAMDEVMRIIESQEGFREEDPQNSRLLREIREVTLIPSGEKVNALVFLFPKEKFNAKDMYAVHAHGGDWRKFVMMPRFDGYQH
ncbi:MAG TPA: gamma-glutamylcyclotransferase [bacterium]|nr:gamma-glutamylcyclotransferase [bacterium]